MIDAPGIYDIPAAEYHADPCPQPSLSNSIAQILLNKSPLHAWYSHPRMNPNYKADDDAKFDVGTAAHAFLLEGLDKMQPIDPQDYPAKNGNIPAGFTNKVIREARDAARAAGKIPVLLSVANDIRCMVEVALEYVAQSEIAGIFSSGNPEQTVIWKEWDWMWCRSRIDWLGERIALDYKSTTDASPEAFSRQLVRMGYHFQDAFYTRGLEMADKKRRKFIFLVQEVEPPYSCSLAACAPMLKEISQNTMIHTMETWHNCMRDNKWPGYSPRIAWADAPAWLINQ